MNPGDITPLIENELLTVEVRILQFTRDFEAGELRIRCKTNGFEHRLYLQGPNVITDFVHGCRKAVDLAKRMDDLEQAIKTLTGPKEVP